MEKYKAGDVISWTKNEYAATEILRVYKNHYHWKYVGSDEVFNSKYSNDPLFQHGWKKTGVSTDVEPIINLGFTRLGKDYVFRTKQGQSIIAEKDVDCFWLSIDGRRLLSKKALKINEVEYFIKLF